MTEEKKPGTFTEGEDLSFWFDGIVDNIRIDQAILESGAASDSMRKTYAAIFNNDDEYIAMQAKKLGTKYIVMNVLKSYLKYLIETKRFPLKLALELSDAKMLVWAEVEDDDNEMENALLIAEAKTNYDFVKSGFHISSFIVEESDHISVPEHYQMVKFEKKNAA